MSRLLARQAEKAQRYQQLIAGFNIYRTASLREALAPLRMTTCVQGLVIGCEAEVVSTDTSGVVFRVNRPQLNALAETGYGFIASPVHGATFRARLDEAHADRKLVSMSDFEPYEDYAERRAASRVAPEDPMLVRVSHDEREFNGQVLDISTAALAARFDAAAADHLEAGDQVALAVWGQHERKQALSDFEVTARVMRSHGEGAGGCAQHVVFVLDSYVALDRRLRAYISARQHRLMVALEQSAA